MPRHLGNAEFNSQIVADGPLRWLAGFNQEALPEIQQSIEQTVNEKYAPQLADAGWFTRIRIRRKMRAEVARCIREEINRLTPSGDALF